MEYNFSYGSGQTKRHTGAFIFVVSHMRSFSSLLCHILGSHPEISGYAEAHLSYFGRTDLDRLVTRLREITGEAVLGHYALDKLLHNRSQIAPAILARPDVKVLILVREPEDSVRSILNMASARGDWGVDKGPDDVVNYYIDRLRALETYGSQLGRGALCVHAERLIDNTDEALAGMSRWLNLEQALSPNYRTFKFTGTVRYGDPSPNILSGRIVRDAEERHRDYADVKVPSEGAKLARAAYLECRAALAKHCTSL